MYICIYDGEVGIGKTITEAFDSFCERISYLPCLNDCAFYECTKIDVKLIKKQKLNV